MYRSSNPKPNDYYRPSFAQLSGFPSASSSPVATHSTFRSQSTSTAVSPRNSFIDLESTLSDAAHSVLNSNIIVLHFRNVLGSFRHKQSGGISCVTCASSTFPTFIDSSNINTIDQNLTLHSPVSNTSLVASQSCSRFILSFLAASNIGMFVCNNYKKWIAQYLPDDTSSNNKSHNDNIPFVSVDLASSPTNDQPPYPYCLTGLEKKAT